MHNVQVSRDSFARMSLMRETLPKHECATCTWCGQPARFSDAWESDGGTRRGMPYTHKPFCSVGRFRTTTETKP